MKNLTLLILTILISFSGRCTHLMGGEIVVQNDQVGNYEILLTLYRDVTGVLLNSNQTLNVYDSGGNQVSTIISSLDSSAFHPVFGIPNMSLLPNNFYGTEIYFYSALFQCFIPGNYTVTWNNCCRNPSIANMVNPGALSMFLDCSFSVDLSTTNSSPYFLSPPIVCVPVNTPWQYNPLPFDEESDSLIWSLGIPYDYVSGSFPNGYPIVGYTLPPCLAGGTLTINPYTGELSWTASVVGNYVYTVICEEYRNGLKLGEIRRDMQFMVLPNGNLPALSNLNNLSTDQNGILFVESMANNTVNLDLIVIDSSSFFISFDGIGEIFEDSINPMTHSIISSNNLYEKQFNLSWTPNSSDLRDNPYIITTRFFNGTFSMDYTFLIYVIRNNTGIEEEFSYNLKSFPNPTSGSFISEISLQQSQNIEYFISNRDGKVVYRKNIFMQNGINKVPFNKNLPLGLYFISMKLENGKVFSDKILFKN
jgi:hypothetical protein